MADYVASLPRCYLACLDDRWDRALNWISLNPVGGGFGLDKPFQRTDVAEVIILQNITEVWPYEECQGKDGSPPVGTDWFLGLLRLKDGRFVAVEASARLQDGMFQSVNGLVARDLPTLLAHGWGAGLFREANIDTEELLKKYPKLSSWHPNEKVLKARLADFLFVALAAIPFMFWLGDSTEFSRTGLPMNCGALVFLGFALVAILGWLVSATRR